MPQPNEHLGPYILLEKLGSGQFGVVWKAQKREGKAPPCAIKLPTDHEIKWADVEKEADVWVRATGHPNIVPLIEANKYAGQIVLVSEYVAGGSLLDWLRAHGGKAPSVARAIEMMSGILAGLEHLHALKIVHRDLKPANIMLQGEIPRLADFGLSRVLSSTQSSMLAGTPAYMSPEALDSDEERTVQTDLWAAGVILYQLLTGRLPFPQRQQSSLMKAIIMNPPEPLPTELPKSLRAVVICALEKDLSKRYKSATAMRQELLSSEKNTVVPPPAPSPTPPQPAPRPKDALLALGGVAVLATGIGIGLWQRTPTDIVGDSTPTKSVEPSVRTKPIPAPSATDSKAMPMRFDMSSIKSDLSMAAKMARADNLAGARFIIDLARGKVEVLAKSSDAARRALEQLNETLDKAKAENNYLYASELLSQATAAADRVNVTK